MVARDAVLNFVCHNGKKFEDDINRVSVSATCVDQNTYQEPSPWGKCVESRQLIDA